MFVCHPHEAWEEFDCHGRHEQSNRTQEDSHRLLDPRRRRRCCLRGIHVDKTLAHILGTQNTISKPHATMNYQVIILITILCAVFVVILGYAFSQMYHKQQVFTLPARTIPTTASEDQRRYMRRVRARNWAALMETADMEAAYGAESEYTRAASVPMINVIHERSEVESQPAQSYSGHGHHPHQSSPPRVWREL